MESHAKKLLKDVDNINFEDLAPQEMKEDDNQEELDEEHIEEESEQMDLDEEDNSTYTNEDEEDEDDIDEETHVERASMKKRKRSPIDDPFFSLDEMEKLSEVDLLDLKLSKALDRERERLGIDDEEEDDQDEGNFDMMYLDEVEDDDEDDDDANIYYDDFFAPPEKADKKKSKDVHLSADGLDSDDDFERERLDSSEEEEFLEKMDEMDLGSQDLSEEDSEERSDMDESNKEISSSEELNEMEDSENEEEDEEEEEEEEEDDETDEESLQFKESMKERQELLNQLKADQNDENLSRYEKEQLKLREKIMKIEEEAISPKGWQMTGETRAPKRPENSLLEEALEFDHASKGKKVVTKEVTLSIEDMIKKRIVENVFDDVVRKVEKPDQGDHRSRIAELDHEKSVKSLSEVYEHEYMKQTQGVNDVDKIKEQHDEASKLFKSICLKLDALTNANFAPLKTK